ncbi:2-C-methyl-D-erythritol 4-phosphate cytidylyltransferase [Tasmannia lanceolata]|uniref:2-C-methyl-D-erythritol 4-phosphate cytidylyltransferase n=1 Tax=Tasmannia lanceolata TaxID=3420 RepID=UPI004063172E
MGGFMALLVAFLFAVVKISLASSSSVTVPAFLWSSHHDKLSYNGVKEIVNYRIISPKDLAKTVLSEGGWSNLVCSVENLQQSVDIALVFVGRKLQSSDISRNAHMDQDLIDLLKVSFTGSSFSMAFPYVSASDEKETMESSIISGFIENCGHQLEVTNVALMDTCSVEGDGLKKLAGFNAFHEYVGSRMQTKLKGQTDLIVFCNGGSESSEEFDQTQSEGKILSELISFLKQSGATYTVLYASDPSRAIQYSSHQAIGRFLAEGTLGNGSADATSCDGVCRIKSSLLEGVFVGIVLLLILLSGLCCMMGIDTPTRFEAPQDS